MAIWTADRADPTAGAGTADRAAGDVWTAGSTAGGEVGTADGLETAPGAGRDASGMGFLRTPQRTAPVPAKTTIAAANIRRLLPCARKLRVSIVFEKPSGSKASIAASSSPTIRSSRPAPPASIGPSSSNNRGVRSLGQRSRIPEKLLPQRGQVRVVAILVSCSS